MVQSNAFESKEYLELSEYLKDKPLYEVLDYDSIGLMMAHVAAYSGQDLSKGFSVKNILKRILKDRLGEVETGRVEISPFWTYIGEYKMKSGVAVPHGFGIMAYETTSYHGWWENGLFSGFGIYKSNEDIEYGGWECGYCSKPLTQRYYIFKSLIENSDELVVKLLSENDPLYKRLKYFWQ